MVVVAPVRPAVSRMVVPVRSVVVVVVVVVEVMVVAGSRGGRGRGGCGVAAAAGDQAERCGCRGGGEKGARERCAEVRNTKQNTTDPSGWNRGLFYGALGKKTK